MEDIHKHVWKINPCQEDGQLKLYVDASSAGFKAVMFGGEKVITKYSKCNPRPHQRSSTSEIEGLIKTLKAMLRLMLGRALVIYTDNLTILKEMRGQTQQDAIIRRLEELMH